MQAGYAFLRCSSYGRVPRDVPGATCHRTTVRFRQQYARFPIPVGRRPHHASRTTRMRWIPAQASSRRKAGNNARRIPGTLPGLHPPSLADLTPERRGCHDRTGLTRSPFGNRRWATRQGRRAPIATWIMILDTRRGASGNRGQDAANGSSSRRGAPRPGGEEWPRSLSPHRSGGGS